LIEDKQKNVTWRKSDYFALKSFLFIQK
jgi:hypothetical protein